MCQAPQIDPKATVTMLYHYGQSLQQYFAGEGFPPQRTAGNIAAPDGIFLFRTTHSNDGLRLLPGRVSTETRGDNGRY